MLLSLYIILFFFSFNILFIILSFVYHFYVDIISYSFLGNSLNYSTKTAFYSASLRSRRDSGAYFLGLRVFSHFWQGDIDIKLSSLKDNNDGNCSYYIIVLHTYIIFMHAYSSNNYFNFL